MGVDERLCEGDRVADSDREEEGVLVGRGEFVPDVLGKGKEVRDPVITTDFVLVWVGLNEREGLRVGVLVGVPVLVIEFEGEFVTVCDRDGVKLGDNVREELPVFVGVREGVGVDEGDGWTGDNVLTESALRKRISQSWNVSSDKSYITKLLPKMTP